MFLPWRRVLVGTCAGGVAAWALCRPHEKLPLHAKATPLGVSMENVIVKGYGCHPRTVKVNTILMYYNIPFQVREYNSLTNDNVYNNIPVVRFEHAEFDWWQSRGDDDAMQQLALVCLKRDLSPPEREWHNFIAHKLTPALEYRMWHSWSSAFEQLQYYRGVQTTSKFRRLVHPYTASVILAFKKNRQLRKMYGVSQGSFKILYQEVCAQLGTMPAEFLGGAQPNLCDLELFGVMSAVRNTRLEAEILEQSPPKVKDWYSRMRQEVYADHPEAWADKCHFSMQSMEGFGRWRF